VSIWNICRKLFKDTKDVIKSLNQRRRTILCPKEIGQRDKQVTNYRYILNIQKENILNYLRNTHQSKYEP
jgi:hypothetical protein